MKKWIVCFMLMLLFFAVPIANAIKLKDVPEDRTIYITEITMTTAMEITKTLDKLDETDGDIRIVLTTPGGQIVAGLMIIDAMDRCHNDIQTYANGATYSMGVYILSKGTKGKRVINQHGQVLMHNARVQYMFRYMTVEDLQDDIDMIEIYQDKLNKILSESTGLSIKDVKELSDVNGITDAESTVELNIVDGIYEGDE